MSETSWKKINSRLLPHFSKSKKLVCPLFFLLQIFSLIFSIFPVAGSKEEYAISIHALEKLALADFSVVMDILKFKDEYKLKRWRNNKNNIDQNLTNQIAGYLQDFEASTGIKIRGEKTETWNFTIGATKGWTEIWMKEMVEKLAENPISAHRLIRRTAIFLPLIVEKVPKKLVFSSQLVKERRFPDDKDIETAADGIIRLSQHYNFPESQLVDGVFGDFETGIKMNALQCFEIGVRSRELGRYTPSFEWLTLALKKTVDADLDLNLDLARKDGPMGVENIERIHKELEITKNEGNLDTSHKRLKSWKSEIQNVNLPQIGRRNHLFPMENVRYFPRLCAGNNYQTEEDKSRLFCWFEFSAHPIYRIGPLKIEFLSREPDIVQIYDFLGDEAIDWLKEEALNPQKSKDYPTIVDAKDSYSVQKEVARVHTVIGEDHPQEIQKLHRQISQATSLKIIKGITAENLAVGSYNFVGHYQPHTDTVAGGPYNPLPRVASFLIYLSDTQSGGITAFCAVGVGARPIKGSAIFWYNLQMDGQLDIKTLHGACPPILSRKIIAQLWIRPYQNFDRKTFSRLSERQQRQRFGFKVNGKIPQVEKPESLHSTIFKLAQ